MFRALPLLLIPAALVAAPVPPESDDAKLKRIYGTVVDPDDDCTFEMIGEKLRIGIPAAYVKLPR